MVLLQVTCRVCMTSEFFPVDVDESPITSLRRREERNTNNLRARLYHVSIKTILYVLNLYEVDVYNDVKWKLDISHTYSTWTQQLQLETSISISILSSKRMNKTRVSDTISWRSQLWIFRVWLLFSCSGVVLLSHCMLTSSLWCTLAVQYCTSWVFILKGCTSSWCRVLFPAAVLCAWTWR